MTRSMLNRFLARAVLLLGSVALGANAMAQATITYFHNDIAGTPMMASNASGVLVWKESYLPYGQRQRETTTSAGNKLWFAGKPYDSQTGLSYMGARYYMPLTGRFTGIDPKDLVPEQPHSFNRYAYANNNPYKYIDLDGRSPSVIVPVVVAGVAITGIVATTHMTPEQRAQMARAGTQFMQRTKDVLELASGWVFNEKADTPKGETDTIVDGVTSGLDKETDSKGDNSKGNYTKPNSVATAEQDFGSLPGTVGSNGQKILPDGSVAGIHTSTSTGLKTLHINRPRGSQNIKIRYIP
ncbi:RHS repeat-associated core domain-containing protein [Verminephrobacter aporrectodeae]|nr:RHS repeat-associated core domain-containing protein [Verminephrobacter aporrectodeae]